MSENIVELKDRLVMKRTPQEVSRERINDALAYIHNRNQELDLAGLIYIGVARDGEKHMLGIAGDADLDPVDMVSLLELQKQAILLLGDHARNQHTDG